MSSSSSSSSSHHSFFSNYSSSSSSTITIKSLSTELIRQLPYVPQDFQSLMTSATGTQLVTENMFLKLVQLEHSGDAPALLEETRKVLALLNMQLEQHKKVYELTMKDLLLEIHQRDLTIRKRDEEIKQLSSLTDDLKRQVSDCETRFLEYERIGATHEQSLAASATQVARYEEQIFQIRSELNQKISFIQHLESEMKSFQNFKIHVTSVESEKISLEGIRKTLLNENTALRKIKTELEAKVVGLEQIKFQLTGDFIKLTETVLEHSNKQHAYLEEVAFFKGRLSSEKELVATLQNQVDGLLSHTKDLGTQLQNSKENYARLTEQVSKLEKQRDDANKSKEDLTKQVATQTKNISSLQSKLDTQAEVQFTKPISENAVKIFSEKFRQLTANHESTLKALEEAQRSAESVRQDRDAAYGALERVTQSWEEVRKIVIQRVTVSFAVGAAPSTPLMSPRPPPPPSPPSSLGPISKEAKMFHQLLNPTPLKLVRLSDDYGFSHRGTPFSSLIAGQTGGTSTSTSTGSDVGTESPSGDTKVSGGDSKESKESKESKGSGGGRSDKRPPSTPPEGEGPSKKPK